MPVNIINANQCMRNYCLCFKVLPTLWHEFPKKLFLSRLIIASPGYHSKDLLGQKNYTSNIHLHILVFINTFVDLRQPSYVVKQFQATHSYNFLVNKHEIPILVEPNGPCDTPVENQSLKVVLLFTKGGKLSNMKSRNWKKLQAK